MKKALFLDRDNTIIVDKIFLNDPDQIEYISGVFQALKPIYEAGYIFVIVTNQSGVPRGLVQEENIHKIHQKIQKEFIKYNMEISAFYYAPYAVDSGHPWRKPGTGMLEQAQKDLQIDLSKSWMLGDRMSDVEAGRRVGCKSILFNITEEEASQFEPPEFTIKKLSDLPNIILEQ